jgi:adenosylcobinamide kinase/adenosylcobinamide-phosphate guanylyltransferase
VKTIVFVTGGGRSGKSAYAVSLARSYSGKRAFIATAEPFDEEMRARIQQHKKERGDEFCTIEEPIMLADVVKSLAGKFEVAVVDCLTVWLGNLMHREENGNIECAQVARLLELLDDPPCDLIIVSNEVGMGVIPHNAMARCFRDVAGRLNQRVAKRAERVILMVSGVPVTVKGENP